ncbi:MAG: TetR/AcrR family transcriptional regulator [Planctomycetaceae bacterium]|nr:TetR/AcrR family transcriptional regulator [Planctomycetaceae bacterium]
MARPSRIPEQRRRLIPTVASAFAELGYHRATTALIARRCRVRENILYRLWRDKKDMFLAAIRYVYDLSMETWTAAAREGRGAAILSGLDYESRHIGEFGNYRVLFAALTETDDPDVRSALRRMYRDMHRFLSARVGEFRGAGRRSRREVELVAWGLIALGTYSTIARELDLAPRATRSGLLADLGRRLVGG